MNRITCASVLVLVLVTGLRGEEPYEPPSREVFQHRLSRVTWIRSTNAGVFQNVSLRVHVDEGGSVVSAEVLEGEPEFHNEALALAKNWKYKPFVQGNRAVAAIFIDYVSLLPPEKPARRDAPFPEVHDWNTVKITLERTRCYGNCPAYRVEISGNGDAYFQGTYPIKQEHRTNVSRASLEKLLSVFRDAHYFGLAAQYRMSVTDNPTTTTSISIDGKTKSVMDYVGLHVGMPMDVITVEEAIDEIAGTKGWLAMPSGFAPWN